MTLADGKKPRSTQSSESPIRRARSIPTKTTLFLYVQAGGRCEFDGCNKYLLEHYPTQTPGNFAQQAHIYAFSDQGPRGMEPERPRNINSLSNLILLCRECHHLIDSERPDDYPVSVLRQFKQDHEDRIHYLTDLSKDRDTVPLVLKGLVHGRPVDISDETMQSAVAPNYLMMRDKVEIDLTAIPDRADAAFWETACDCIDSKCQYLYSIKPRRGRTLRISIFALAPIPLLVYLGSKLSDKMEVDLYQRHRAPEKWSWKEGAGKARYTTRTLHVGKERTGPVVLLLNLSGANGIETIPSDLVQEGSIYEITLEGQDPNPMFLNTRADLERFSVTYIRTLAMIRQAHPKLDTLHMLPAVPAPVAIVLGRALLPKVDPKLRIYDRSSRLERFAFALELT